MAQNAVNIIITAKDEASKVFRSLNRNMAGTERGFDNLDGSSRRSSSSLGLLASAGTAAKVGLIGAGVAAIAAGKEALSASGSFEQALNMFRAVSGATAYEMGQVSARARELGKDVSLPGISAKDASLAMLELSKAGLSVNDTLAASKGVLSLAKAGQLETAQAAEIAANALNAFRMKGTVATKVADILAAAANASSAGVQDLAFGLQMSSASAAAMKVPLDETVAALAEFANNGLRGSDAGTSLKTFMMRFTPTTDDAAEAMQRLNLKFYDAKGNFVGMREVIRQLQVGTANLTDEQKAQTLQTIFGSDAIRAANILVKEGVEGFDRMTKAVNRQGAATELAAAQNAGFKGALDGLKSTIETIGIEIGSKTLPTLTKWTNALNRGLSDALERFTNKNYESDKASKQFMDTMVRSMDKAHGWATSMNLVTAAQQNLKGAQQAADTAARNYSVAQDAYVVAWKRSTAAANDVAKAQQNVKLAMDTYGANSPQYIAAVATLKQRQDELNAAKFRELELSLQLAPKNNELAKARDALAQATRNMNAAQDYLNNGLDGSLGRIAKFGPTALNQVRGIATLQGAVGTLVASWNGFAGGFQQQSDYVNLRLLGNTKTAQQLQNTINNINRSSGVQFTGGGTGLQGGGRGFADGGFTGRGGENQPAGIVHRGEYVIPKEQVDQNTGMPKMSAGMTINQTNNIFNQVDLNLATERLGWELAAA
jgi:TP901 family phage tail tape measure protein